MANKVANVDDVTGAISGSAVLGRVHHKAHHLPALNAMPGNLLRSHLTRMPDVAAEVAEPILDDHARTEPGTSFTSKGRTGVAAGAVTAMAANAFDGRLYVADYAADSVAVLDGYTLSPVSTIVGVGEPYALAVARGRAYISSVAGAHDALTVTDSESVLDSHAVADTVQDVVVDREGRYAYVARTGRQGADVAVVNTATGAVRTVDLASRAGEVAGSLSLSGDGRMLFVATTDQLGGRLVVIDTADLRVFDSLTVAEPIRGLAAGHDGHTVWLATDDGEAGGLVDMLHMPSHRVVATVAVGSPVRQLMLSAVGDRVYAVTDTAVAVVCANTHELVDEVGAGTPVSCVTESADGSRLYVADYDGGVTLYSVASTTPSVLDRIATPEALAGPAVRELERV